MPAAVNSLAAVVPVLRLVDSQTDTVAELLCRFGMTLKCLPAGADIPGSYWGDSEAGLLGNEVHVRGDTPLHSLLHEACHYICMDEQRRARLDRDAGGDHDEENAVCYLQILLADQITGFGRQRMLADMDAWGYTFRLGSAQRWFEQDATDAAEWLLQQGIIDRQSQPTFQCRQTVSSHRPNSA